VIPSSWPGFKVDRIFRGTRYGHRSANPDGSNRASARSSSTGRRFKGNISRSRRHPECWVTVRIRRPENGNPDGETSRSCLARHPRKPDPDPERTFRRPPGLTDATPSSIRASKRPGAIRSSSGYKARSRRRPDGRRRPGRRLVPVRPDILRLQGLGPGARTASITFMSPDHPAREGFLSHVALDMKGPASIGLAGLSIFVDFQFLGLVRTKTPGTSVLSPRRSAGAILALTAQQGRLEGGRPRQQRSGCPSPTTFSPGSP